MTGMNHAESRHICTDALFTTYLSHPEAKPDNSKRHYSFIQLILQGKYIRGLIRD
jgi:hypothetical protein